MRADLSRTCGMGPDSDIAVPVPDVFLIAGWKNRSAGKLLARKGRVS